jgi:hypothetical protein
MELVRTADGARPKLVKPTRAFDPEVYQHQMIAGRADLPLSGKVPSPPVP